MSKRSTLHFYQELGIVVAVGVVVLLAERVGWGSQAVVYVQKALVPLASGITAFVHVVESPLYSLNHMYASSQELAAVKVKYAESLAQLTELEQLKTENQQLRQMMENRHIPLAERIIAAPIVSYAYPAVAAGSSQGVKPGGLIIVADTLVGRIAEVSAEESRVELLSNRDAQPVLAQTASGVQGLVQGTGKGVVLTQLPTNVEMNPGERVSTVGQPGIRQGIFLGIVSSNQVAVTAPIKTVPLDQFVSFYTTQLVEIW